MNPRTCSSCGRTLPSEKFHGAIMNCPYCDAPVEQNGSGSEQNQQYNTPINETPINDTIPNAQERFPPTGTRVASRLRVGLKGKLSVGEVEIVGRVCYKNREGYGWSEWALKTPEGEFYWLEEDEGNYRLVQEFTPKMPFDPESVSSYEKINIDGSYAQIGEIDTSRVTFFEGVLPWKPSLKEQAKYLSARSNMMHFSVEWNEHEINFYKGWQINRAELLKSFSLNPMGPQDIFAFVVIGFVVLSFLFVIIINAVFPPNPSSYSGSSHRGSYGSHYRSGGYRPGK